MCIIAAKPAGIAMPNDTIITNMWDNNPDGAGIMYAIDGHVHIEKGFMHLSDFEDALARIRKTVDLDKTGVVMHFRIATHGGIKPENTHPFPVSSNMGALRKLVCNTPLGVAHNGIIHSVTPRDKNTSDTMEFVVSCLSLMYKSNPRFLKDKYMLELTENLAGSRLAFLTGDGVIRTLGTGWSTDNGIMYSNHSYETYKFPSYTSCSNWSWGEGSSVWDMGGYYDDYEPNIVQKKLMPVSDIDGAFYTNPEGEQLVDTNYSVFLDSRDDVWIMDEETYLCWPDVHHDMVTGVYDELGNRLRYDPEYAFECDCEEWK